VTDRAAPNLPSRDLATTVSFYGGFGFAVVHRDDFWLVLRRGDLQLEFFLKADLDPRHHDFGCCLRVADLEELYAAVRAAGVPLGHYAHPSVRPIALQPWGQRMSTVLDPDGNLLRMIEDGDGAVGLAGSPGQSRAHDR
jgi:catechol 2,3-dioxygenase-like lactoylglutathione lyase family enzyme